MSGMRKYTIYKKSICVDIEERLTNPNDHVKRNLSDREDLKEAAT